MTAMPTIPRRAFLRGLGTLMGLPLLEAMGPVAAAEEVGGPGAPRRLAFLYIPNGAHMPAWTPKSLGADFELPPTLESLAPYRSDLLVLSGLTHDKARPNGDGAGDHARAAAAFLTGCQARKTDGANIQAGVSADQIVAQRFAGRTRLASLELGCDRGQQSGNCDSGYSCAYSFNLSWRAPATPMPPESDPRLVFERLFAGTDRKETAEARARRRRYERSLLDYVQEDARRLQGQLGASDRGKLDEYLTAVRELELRLEQTEKLQASLPAYDRPSGVPDTYEQHLRLLFDLLALAFQTDTTRVATFMLAHEGSNRAYPFLGVRDGHHDLSHHGNDEAKQAKLAVINRFHMAQFAYFLSRLKAAREGKGTLLDNCLVVYGGAIGDGNAHNHDELPVILAGRGGGTIEPGRHVRYPRNTPMTNLYLSLLDRMNVPVERIGDSTGRLASI